MPRFIRRFALALSLACCCSIVAAFATQAAPPGGKGKGGDAPISVEADHMTSLEKSNSVLFTGAVDARQDDVRIRTDKMTVYYTPENKAKAKKGGKTAGPGGQEGQEGQGGQKVEKMVCVGNVEISRSDWLGTSKEMTYLAKERQVHLVGNAKAWQGQNMVSGERIIHYIDEERSEVLAGPKRPSAVVGDKPAGPGKPGRVNMTILQK
ncbi:MAG: lipopolysaccharide transport periplasmic protein LptA [Desulfobulbaceae bacterium]|nr:lipopolysaccharide transport periplasmic protein LptA [Desulfobulbaceae bacterium]